MRRFRLLTLLVVFITLIEYSTYPAHAQSPDNPGDIASALATEETVRVVVSLRTPAVGLQAQAVTLSQNEVLDALPVEDFQLIQQYEVLPGLAGQVTAQGLAMLLNQPEVEAVALDLPVQVALTESVVLIGADTVWNELGFTGAGVNVAVLDTGIDTDHPDLVDNLVAQKCFGHGTCPPDNTDESNSAEDGNGHGTHIAGIITGRGTTSPRGGAPDAGIVAVRVMGNNGTGYTSDVIAAMDWLLAHQDQFKAKAINLSLGGGAYPGVCDNADANTQLYAEAVRAANHAGITVFAASGNRGLADALMAPACISGVVAVGSTYDANLGTVTLGNCTDTNATVDQVACVSNSGSELDLLAPGVAIDSTALGGGQRQESGTSMSTAHAAAVAALMLQADPLLTPAGIETVLKETGVPITDHRNGRVTPRVDALAAVTHVAGIDPITIAGTVRLQGRSNHSGAEVFVSMDPCAEIVSGAAAAATTGPDGYFEIVALPAGQRPQCLQVLRFGYLSGQHSAPAGNLGVITLPAGDFNNDNVIDILDLTYVAVRYAGNDMSVDVTGDGLIDIFDLVIVARNYNKHGPVENWQK
ncbi:MAG: S8 family serine peptidase [Anaerolineae bacterium]|nr:S8 family serine peptidase [Anaerolineae bacterium]